MPAKESLSLLEHYLAAQLERNMAELNSHEREAREKRLQQATRDLEKAMNTANNHDGIRKILVAVDHEHHAALEAALKIARPLPVQIAIVYVLEPLPAANLEMAYDNTPSYHESRTTALEMLGRFEREIPPHVLAFTILREGRAASEIVAAARDFNADLIIMGTHRRGPLARFFMGSVSQDVLRRAHCPVMFVTDLAPVTSPPMASHAT